MYLEVDHSQLQLITARVQGAPSEKTMAHLGIRASKTHGLLMQAADSSIAAFVRTPADVRDEGVVFVNARLFIDLVRELPPGTVRMSLKDHSLRIEAGKDGSFLMKIPLINEGVWRDAPEFTSGQQATLPSLRLAYMIEQIEFCIAQEAPRHFATVAYLHRPDSQKKLLRIVGTDAFRLVYCDVEVDVPDAFLRDAGICLTKRSLGELLRLCHEGAETVTLQISDDHTTLRAEILDFCLYVRLSAVRYPNYRSAIPTLGTPMVSVPRGYIQSVTKRVLLASDKGRVLQLHFAGSSLTLSSKNLTHSESREIIHLDEDKAPKCELSVNGKYLADIFGTMATEKLRFQVRHQQDPIVLMPENEPKGCQSMHVLVPISTEMH